MNLVLFIVYIVYGLPSTILYILAIYVIVKKRSTVFSGSFYVVYLNLLLVDLVTYLNTYLNLKLREVPGLADYWVGIEVKIPPYRFFIMLSFVCYHLQNTASLLMHLNRFTCTVFPLQHQEIWKYGAYPMISILTIYGFGASWPVPLVNGMYVKANGEVARSAAFYEQLAGLYVFMDIMGKVYIGIAVFLNVGTVARLVYLRYRGQKLSNSQEVGLFVMAFATFVSQILCQYVITQISTVASAYVSYSNIISSVNSDIFSLSEVYIGLIFNRVLRLHVKEIIFGKPNCNRTVTTVSVRGTSLQ